MMNNKYGLVNSVIPKMKSKLKLKKNHNLMQLIILLKLPLKFKTKKFWELKTLLLYSVLINLDQCVSQKQSKVNLRLRAIRQIK